MIEVSEVLQAVPHFETFCSVQKLAALVERLRADSTAFEIRVAGTSVNGLPIHHVRFGNGAVKALFVAFPHPNEPIGGMTAFSLLSLLNQRHPALVNADIEWHIVPCADPDGAILNEGWTQQPFTFARYLKNFHRQELRDQVECSFPIKYKRLEFTQPTKEASVLRTLLDDIRPDFYFSLHNLGPAGPAYFGLTREIDAKYYRELQEPLAEYRIPPRTSPCLEGRPAFAEGIERIAGTIDFYDLLEKTTPWPERLLPYGACSWDYLGDLKADALSFIAELPHVKHHNDGSTKATGQNLRRLRLRVDAEQKFVVAEMLEQWERVKEDLDSGSPFYSKMLNGLVIPKDSLVDGLPTSPYKTRDLVFNPAYNRGMVEEERLAIYTEWVFQLSQLYEFVRMLKVSKETSAVTSAIARLESIFDEALVEISEDGEFDQYEIMDCDTLAKVQLGSGLIVLNSILQAAQRGELIEMGVSGIPKGED